MSERTETRRYTIDGMHCTSCAMNIDWELEDVPGVKKASTSYADAVTEVQFDPTVVDEREIVAAVQRAGFAARRI